MLGSLKGQTVVITGAGPGGLGSALPAAFAGCGANLVLNHLQEGAAFDDFAAGLDEAGVAVSYVHGDVSREQTAQRVIDVALAEHGGVDVLVNNAAITTPAPIEALTLDAWQRTLDVNLTGVYLMTRVVVPVMRRARAGRIISIASQVGQKGGVDHAHYAAAKAGVIAFSKSVAREVAEDGITVNCVAPGPLEGGLMTEVPQSWKDAKLRELVIPRFGTPDEVVPSVLFLASSPAGNLYTGQTLGPNSGDVML